MRGGEAAGGEAAITGELMLARSHSAVVARMARIVSMLLPKNAFWLGGSEAMASIVARLASPTPKASSCAPSALSVAACAIAVLSSPSTVCSPSVRMTTTRDTPLAPRRELTPLRTCCTAERPSEIDVAPSASMESMPKVSRSPSIVSSLTAMASSLKLTRPTCRPWQQA